MQEAGKTHKAWRRWLHLRQQSTHILVQPAAVTPQVVFQPPELVVPPAQVEQSPTMIAATVVMAITSIAMLAVAGVTASISKDQWSAMRDQIEQAKTQLKQNNLVLDQMRLEQRAWVSIRRPEFSEPEMGKPLRWRMQLVNTGQTPALVEKVEFNLALRLGDVVFDPNGVKLVASKSLQQSLAPGADVNFPFVSTNNIVDKVMLGLLKNPKANARIYVFGLVHYEDVAGVKRETEFALVNESGSNTLRFHHMHNRMR